MSDYEGEWEPIAPRGNIIIPTTALAVPPDPAHNYIVPKGRTLQEAEQSRRDQKDRSRKSSAITLPRDYRRTLQAFRPRVAAGRYNSRDANGIERPREDVRQKVQSLPAYQKFMANPENSDDVYHLIRSIKNITASLPKQSDQPPQNVFRDRILAICIDTNAFIAKSSTGADAFDIWGEPSQISLAKENLHAFEMNAVAATNHQKATPAWSKKTAFDGRAENRLMRENWINHQRQFFQQETDDETMPYQAHLYWPDGYDLDNFIQDYGDSVLQELMNKYDCIIRQKTVERVTKVGCETQQALFQVYNRLMGLVREMVGRKQSGLYATHCEVPSASGYKDRVKFSKLQVGGKKMNICSLMGKPLPLLEYEQWTQLSYDINKRYRLATKNALQSCINGIHISRKDVRLRIIFGDPGLVKVMKPADGQETYQIDDFLTKVQQPGTTVTQCSLQEGTSSQLIDNIDSFDEFSPLDISWEVSFDFSGGHDKILTLVKEYIPNVIDPDEPSLAATRWLMHSDSSIEDKSDLLTVNHIDLETVGYQMYLGGGALFQNEKTMQDLRSFEGNIKFRPSMNGLRYEPTKHVVHPYGNQELTTMRETAIAKYRFRDTKGTFEIRRTDHFNSKPGEASPVPLRTSWSAQYYYAGWDNLLSEFANIEPGQDVQWKRDLKTFFPKVEDPNNPQLLPAGFKHFMKEVDELKTLVARALGRTTKESQTKNNTNTNNNNHSKSGNK